MTRANRRRFLAVAAGALAGAAGCIGGRADEGGGSGTTPAEATGTPTRTSTPTRTTERADAPAETETEPGDGSETETPSREEEPAEERVHPRRFEVDIDHPAATELGKEPFIGKPPEETGHVIVEFTDVSCDVCAAFHETNYPRLYTELIQPGKATFVYRDFPRTDPWTQVATYALDATYFRDPGAYELLKSYVYSHQFEFTVDNVYDRIHGYLSRETDVDADAVVAEMRSDAWEEAGQRDLRAKDAADVNGTPTFFLFKRGEYVTRFRGNQNLAVFENALQL